MAVIAVWKCDRDGKMFDDKKAADEHDKMLEFAANITAVIEREVKSVDEAAAEEIGILFAKHRELLAMACKGKPEKLLEMNKLQPEAGADKGNVTSLAASK